MNKYAQLRQYVELHLEGRSEDDADNGYNHVAFINDLDAPNATGLSVMQVGDLVGLRDSSPLCAVEKQNNRLPPGRYEVVRREWAFFDNEFSTAGTAFLCIHLKPIP